MKTKLTCIVLALIGFTGVKAQVNLVPNPSFEEYYVGSGHIMVNGITTNNMRNCSYNWFNVKGTVDLYTYHNITDIDNGCMGAGERWKIPPTIFGYNYPRTDSCFIGLATWANFYDNPFEGHNYYVREWAGVRLLDSLKAGECYNYTMYVARSTKTGFNVSCLGAYFSKDSLFSNANGQYITPFPMDLDSIQVQQNPNIPIWDSSWVPISGTFKAKGGETFLYIGNLLKDEFYTPLPIEPYSDSIFCASSNFFIDDVSLYEIEEPCGVGVNEIKAGQLKIYPNPAQEFVSVVISQQSYTQTQLSVYNLTGQLIMQQELVTTNQQIPITELNNGVYIFVIQNGDKVIGRERVIVSK